MFFDNFHVHSGKGPTTRLSLARAASVCAIWIGFSPICMAADEDTQVAVATPRPGPPYVVPESAVTEIPTAETSALHGQFTGVTQWHPGFSALYSGPNSLDSTARSAGTVDLTLFAGLRFWKGGEAWFNPEIDQGFGLNNTLGIAGFSSGEAYKIGANAPYLRIPRAFFRQVFNLGGDTLATESAPNQLAGTRQSDNVTITVGKFSVVDIFDTNAYSHDPRADFLNWSIIDAGGFDYAADSWGYTYGGSVEWTTGRWTARGGVFDLSTLPNSKLPNPDFREYALIAELEERHQWRGHDGKLKVLAFDNRGRMAKYEDAVRIAATTGGTPDVSQVRHFTSRPGLALNLEQEATSDLGFFARASVNDGSKEAFDFTDINRSLSAGLALGGDRWGRRDDTFGFAGVANGLSSAARDYFAAGGLGILVGDGRLNYGVEKIVETYYSLSLDPHLKVTLNYQYVSDPAYNRDRGPVSIFGIRVHAEF
jgi:high affinity Mn2+ porin